MKSEICSGRIGFAGILARLARAIHCKPGKEWTVAELVAESHMPRSVFAGRFKAIIGVPPLRYVTAFRMRVARQWLRYKCF